MESPVTRRELREELQSLEARLVTKDELREILDDYPTKEYLNKAL